MGRYLSSRQDSVVDCRMPVRYKDYGIAERHGATSSCVNAKLALKSADEQVGDALRLEKLVQPCIVKGIRSGLPQVSVAAVHLKRWRKAPTICSVVHVTIFRFMLDDNDE